jgi:BNR repeat-like domain
VSVGLADRAANNRRMPRRRFVAPVLAALALCGAAFAAHPAGAAEGGLAFSPPVTAIPLGQPTRPYDLPYWPSGVLKQGEPRLVVTRTGDVYLGAHFQPFDCATGAKSEFPNTCLWRSSDEGESFTIAGGDVTGQSGADVDVTELASGTLLTVAMTNITPPGQTHGVLGAAVARSADGGKTWTTQIDVNDSLDTDRPFLIADGKYAHITYTATPGNVFVVTSSDDGLTWGSPVPITPLTAAQAHTGNGAPLRDEARDEIVAPYYYDSDEAGCNVGTAGCLNAIGVARSRDHGATWTQEPIVTLTGRHGVDAVLTAAADASGREYLAYSDVDGATGRSGVIVMRQDRAGAPWVQTTRIDGPDTSSLLPSVVAGRDGRVAVAWFRTPYADGYQQMRPWHVSVALSTDAGRRWDVSDVSETDFVGTGSDHRGHVYDLLALGRLLDDRVIVCWTHQGLDPTAQTTVQCGRQSAGPHL